jgi:hypothetical protein
MTNAEPALEGLKHQRGKKIPISPREISARLEATQDTETIEEGISPRLKTCGRPLEGGMTLKNGSYQIAWVVQDVPREKTRYKEHAESHLVFVRFFRHAKHHTKH